jgi:hypothetical protein
MVVAGVAGVVFDDEAPEVVDTENAPCMPLSRWKRQ